MSTLSRKLLTCSADVDAWILLFGTATFSSRGWDCELDSNEDIYFAGYKNSNIPALVKIDSTGSIVWDRVLNGTNTSQSLGVACDPNDNLYFNGYSNDTGSIGGTINFYVGKYNSTGGFLGDQFYGASSGTDLGIGCDCDSSSNFYTVGRYNNGTRDNATVVKWNSSLAVQWHRHVSAGYGTQFFNCHVDGSNNIYAVGRTLESPNKGEILKLNSAGTELWHRSYVGTDTTYFNGLTTTGSDVYVAGEANGFPQDAVLVKYNSSGTLQWQRQLTGTGSEKFNSVAVTSGGDIIVIGTTNTNGNGVLIASYDSSGNLNWQNQITTTSGIINGEVIVIDSNDNMYIAGDTTDDGPSAQSMMLVKLPADGTGLGTYGNLTYETATLTASTPSLTDAAIGVSLSSTALSTANPSLTSATASFTEELLE